MGCGRGRRDFFRDKVMENAHLIRFQIVQIIEKNLPPCKSPGRMLYYMRQEDIGIVAKKIV